MCVVGGGYVHRAGIFYRSLYTIEAVVELVAQVVLFVRMEARRFDTDSPVSHRQHIARDGERFVYGWHCDVVVAFG